MRLILFIFLLLFGTSIHAQLPQACNGTAPAIACDQACISCNFDGYTGDTYGFPTSIAPEFCGTIENAQWLGFIAGANNATFTIVPSNCANGDGLQVALYSDCQKPPLACEKGQKDGGSLAVTINVPISVGGNYFLLIDGYAGDQCEFSVDVTPKEAVFEPPLELAQVVEGPAALCPGATFTFTTLPVYGAGAYIWSGPPGTLFDSMPSPHTVIGQQTTVEVTAGNQSGPICVQAANTCRTNPPCTAQLDLTILGEDFKPNIMMDTVASLTCTDAPLSIQVQVNPIANVDFQWSTDSLGHIVSNDRSLNVLIDSIGTYFLYARDRVNGCQSRDSIRVLPQNYPTGIDFRTESVTCYGLKDGELLIDSVRNGTSPFLFSIDDSPYNESPNLAQIAPGVHTLAVEGIDGCGWDTTFTINEPAELLVVLGADTTLGLGQDLVLWDSTNVNYPERILRWVVQGPNQDTLPCRGCPYEPLQSFAYQLTVFDSNGCTATDERSVFLRTTHAVYVPNVFNPAIDAAQNDRFGLYCSEEVAVIKQFKVADRWGQIVFQRQNDLPNDYNSRWDGRINNRLALPGVYVYWAEVEFIDGSTKILEGDVALVR